jgi:starch synthase (maltosyl-transferring)
MAVGATAGRRRPTKALVPRSDLPNGPDHGLLAHIVVQDVRPSAPHGYPAKAVVGELIPVVAAIFKDGHDVLAAQAVLRKGTDVVATSALVHLGNDVWSGAVTATEMGGHELIVEAWTDRYATWAHKATVKLAAHQDVEVELAEAQDLLSEWAPGAGAGTGAETSADSPIAHALVALSDEGAHDADRINPALSAAVAHALAGPRLARDLTTAGPVPIWVDRPRAAAGAWYELFPRSFGGLRGAAAQIPRLAQLGFDVLYIPPVHPIGHSFRKGKNNTLTAGPGDPGSPWAIGSEDGGHLAIDPGLGTFEDFDNLVRTATDHGMEVALDIAFQCSPDHPWVKEHPEWFHHRPDGSIAYAENPPKKYQDIYPLNFWPFDEGDRLALWQACEKIFVFWAERGIRIFRVDNPHTKPFAFWEWVLAAVRSEWPDAVFLAEAFTRPKVMARLAEVGFSQSYTYFTWRLGQYGPEGLRAYVEELAHGPLADYMRPNFWPNTPDILSGPLRGGPPSAFALRYVLAATLAPSYGVYSGYELFENEPASPDNEEYLNSEKYEIKHRDLSRPGSLSPLFAAINESRKRHPAFASLRSVRFHGSDNPSIMAYSKRSDDGDDIVLVVVTLDPYAIQESVLHIDLDALGLAPDCLMDVKDELSGETYTWGAHPYVRLDPYLRVAHVFAVNAQARGRA